jgi:hypothetical protein
MLNIRCLPNILRKCLPMLNTNEISMYHKGWMVANNIIVKHLMD